MKKLLSFFILFFAFSFSAFAQEITPENEEITKIQAYEVADYLGIKDVAVVKELQSIIATAHYYSQQGLNEERKIIVSRQIQGKLEGVLSKNLYTKLTGNKAFYSRYFE